MLTKRVQSWWGRSSGCRWGILFVTLCLLMPGDAREAIADEKSAIEAIEFFGGEVRQNADGSIWMVVLRARDLTDSNVLPKLDELSDAREISIDACEFDAHELASLKRHRDSLQTLSLSGTPIDDEALTHIGALTELELLYLRRVAVDGAALAHLEKLKKLKLLRIAQMDIGDEAIEHLAKLEGLKELNIYGPHKFTVDGEKRLREALPDCAIALRPIRYSDQFTLKHIGLPAHLAVMSIQQLGGYFGKEGNEIQRIGVRGQDIDKTGTLNDFQNLPHLQCVVLSKCQFDPRNLKHLLVSKDCLQELYLNDTPTDDEALQDIGKLAHLTMLGLSRTKVTSAGMVHLTGLTNLKFLSLGGTAVGDDAIEHLSKLKSLKKLAIVGETKFTDDGQKKLKQALPDCAVEFRPAPR